MKLRNPSKQQILIVKKFQAEMGNLTLPQKQFNIHEFIPTTSTYNPSTPENQQKYEYYSSALSVDNLVQLLIPEQ